MKKFGKYFGKGCIGAFLINLTCAVLAQCNDKPFAPCKLYETADVVFVGTVKQVDYSDPIDEIGGLTKKRLRNKIVLLTIKESFKGIADKQSEIAITISQIQRRSQTGELIFERHVYANCPFDGFMQDESYLVYAKREQFERHTIFLTDHAIKTIEAEPAIAYLRNQKADHRAAMLYGKILRKVRGFEGGFPEIIERPIRNIRIEIQSEKQTFIATTDDQGHYLFSDIPPNDYSIKSHLPEQLEVENMSRKISLAAKSCRENNIVALTTGEISGTVFSHEGKPKAVEVELVVAAEAGKPKPRKFVVTADWQTGRFEFKNIPPASYLLGFHTGKLCDQKMYHGGKMDVSCQHRTYYPGVSDITQAILVNLTEGEKLKNLDFNLLPPFTKSTVSGIALLSDGKPAVNAEITLMVVHGELVEFGGLATTDEYGRYSMFAYNDLKSWVSAIINIKGKYLHSEPSELLTNGDINETKLVLSSSGKFCSLCYNKYWKRKGTPPQ